MVRDLFITDLLGTAWDADWHQHMGIIPPRRPNQRPSSLPLPHLTGSSPVGKRGCLPPTVDAHFITQRGTLWSKMYLSRVSSMCENASLGQKVVEH